MGAGHAVKKEGIMSKLDEFMAVDVMGVGVKYENGFILTLNPTPFYTNDSMETWEPWSPTTDMNRAMQCVEKWLLDENTAFNMRWGVYDWLVEVGREDDYGNDSYYGREWDKSAPLAICRALAKAKGFKDV